MFPFFLFYSIHCCKQLSKPAKRRPIANFCRLQSHLAAIHAREYVKSLNMHTNAVRVSSTQTVTHFCMLLIEHLWIWLTCRFYSQVHVQLPYSRSTVTRFFIAFMFIKSCIFSANEEKNVVYK